LKEIVFFNSNKQCYNSTKINWYQNTGFTQYPVIKGYFDNNPALNVFWDYDNDGMNEYLHLSFNNNLVLYKFKSYYIEGINVVHNRNLKC
jgi:hypothetical protein